MKTAIALYFFISLFMDSLAQQPVHPMADDKLKLEKGQTINISLLIKSHITQQAGGQAIDFTLDATGDHNYKVTNVTHDNSTLHHQLNRIQFHFDGWGRKMNFDSDNETDLNGIFGGPWKDLMSKSYDIIIDSSGKVLMAIPEKIQLVEKDNRMAIVHNLLKDVFDLAYPPQKDKASFFKILPDNTIKIKDAWTDSWQNDAGKFDIAYAVTDINDSTIVVEFVSGSVTTSKMEMSGAETTTTMNNRSAGKIIIDRFTGILKEKNELIESNGNTVSSFGTLPVTSKTSITVLVK